MYAFGRHLVAAKGAKKPFEAFLMPDSKNQVLRLPHILRHVADVLADGGVKRLNHELWYVAELATMEEVTEKSASKPELKVG